MTFDDDGNPNITFIVHPDMGEHLRRLSEKWGPMLSSKSGTRD